MEGGRRMAKNTRPHRAFRLAALSAAALAVSLAASAAARAAEPIKIGFGMALTGGLAPNGKAALLAMQIWEKEQNAKGGLLGRPWHSALSPRSASPREKE